MSKGKQTRNDILQTAFELATLCGLEGLSIGILAKEVGMSKSGLFAHFQSKEKLQIAVLEWARERFIERVLSPCLTLDRGVPRLEAYLHNYLASWHGSERLPGGCVFISGAAEFDDQPGAVHDYLKRTQSELIDSLARMAQGAVDTGQFSPECDVQLFAFEIFSLFLGFHYYHRLLEDGEAAEKLSASFNGHIKRQQQSITLTRESL